MIPYLTQSILCMAFLLAAYFLLLEREKMYCFNRFYLLLSLAFSVLIPFVPYTVYIEAAPIAQAGIVNEPGPDSGAAVMHSIEVAAPSTNYFMPLLFGIYLLGVGFFLFRFSRNVFTLLLATRKHKRISYGRATLILTDAPVSNFTFFNYIFVNARDYTTQRVEKELLTHELAHVRQLHSLDVMLIEILLIVFWFNPVLILYKRAIQLNHEYLADDAVLSVYNDPQKYQALLLSKAELFRIPLANSFNYLITKKRLIMMTKKFSRTRAACKQLATLPLAAIAVFLFSTRVEAQVATQPAEVLSRANPEKENTSSDTTIKPLKKAAKAVKTRKRTVSQSTRAAVLLQSENKAVSEGKEQQADNQQSDQEPVPMAFVELMPEFPGGINKFKEFIVTNTPHNGTSGTVEAIFYIEKDGSVVVTGLPKGADNINARALMKTLQGSPFWKPAVQNGRVVVVGYVMSVSFKEKQDIIVDKISVINEEMMVSFEKRESDGKVFVQGLVLNKEGKPLAGVSILGAGYKGLAVSGGSGRFAFSLPDIKPLVFTCIGYSTKRISL